MLSINWLTKSVGIPSVVEGGCPLTAAKMMASTAAIVGDCLTFALFDDFIDVHCLPSQTPSQRTREGRLARGHEADEIDLVDPERAGVTGHVAAAIRASSSKNPG